MEEGELAEINGIKPKVVMADGDEREVKRTWDHYYCTCPAWRNQGKLPINARSCKHLKSLLGEEYEAARLQLKNPHAPSKSSSKTKAGKGKSASKRKTSKEDEDEEAEKPAKKVQKPNSADDEDPGVEEEDPDESPTHGKSVPKLLLANKWDLADGIDPTGWWISEKLDGVRAFFDGKRMISRLGNPFVPPQWFLSKFPKDITLDGELFAGRGRFQSTVSIVKTANSPHWKEVTFQIFDTPSHGDKPFEDRIELLKKMFGPGGAHQSEQIHVLDHTAATSHQHVLDKLKEIEHVGGEGLMLRKPGSFYEGHRSGTLLKVKTFHDAEAIVTGYTSGKGRNKGVIGALKCKMASGKTFNVGTGLNDKIRANPPKIGAVITYRFQELTYDNVPRFPSYVGIAIDKTEPKDADVARKTSSAS